MKKELIKGEIKMFEKLKKIKENKVLKFIGNLLYTLMFLLVVLLLVVVIMQRVTNNNITIGSANILKGSLNKNNNALFITYSLPILSR